MNKKHFNALNDFLSGISSPIYIITKNYLFVKINNSKNLDCHAFIKARNDGVLLLSLRGLEKVRSNPKMYLVLF